MAAFAAAVKIDSFAYMPVQDFGNAFSTFVAQNYGARQYGRIREGIQKAVRLTLVFCLAVSVFGSFLGAASDADFRPAPRDRYHCSRCGPISGSKVHATGASVVCSFCMAYHRAIKRPAMSLILTVISLGTRVALAYALAGPVEYGAYGSPFPSAGF